MMRAVAGGFVCGGGTCPTCGGESTAIIGPCDYCTEYFHEKGKFPRRKKRVQS